jgi:hypothetical protein
MRKAALLQGITYDPTLVLTNTMALPLLACIVMASMRAFIFWLKSTCKGVPNHCCEELYAQSKHDLISYT